MPISNLAIQRRRLNELKKLGYQNPEPHTFESYTKFILLIDSFSTEDAKKLNNLGFFVDEIEAHGRGGMVAIIHKDPIEKSVKTYRVKEIQN